VDLVEGTLLVAALSLDFLAKLELLVKGRIFTLHDVHHEHGAACVLFCPNDFDLSPVVLQLGHNVDQHLFKTFNLPTERHVLLSL